MVSAEPVWKSSTFEEILSAKQPDSRSEAKYAIEYKVLGFIIESGESWAMMSVMVSYRISIFSRQILLGHIPSYSGTPAS